MKKILIIAFSIFSIFLAGCLKDNPNVDFSKNGTILELEYPAGAGNNGLGTGLEYFGGGAITFPASDAVDTISFMANVASTSPLGKDLTVTIAIDPTVITTYNSNNTIQFVQLPDSDFTVINTTAKVAAGSRLATYQLVVFPSKIDPTQNYMLPIVIKDAQGYTISGNFSTIYFHTIGNPLAGLYDNVSSTRYNYTGNITYTYPGAYPAWVSTLDLSPYYPKLVSPIDPTTIAVPYSNLGGSGYDLIVTFDPVTLAITGVTPNATMNAGVSNFLVYYSNYDPVTKTLHFITHYNNGASGSGNDRIIDEKMIHQ